MNNELMQRFALWARSKNIPRPSNPVALKVLFATFLQDTTSALGQYGAPNHWEEIADKHRLELSFDGASTEIVDSREAPANDWDEMIEQREQAMAEGGGDDLSREAILLERQRVESAAKSPFVNTNPPSAGTGTLGSSATVTAPVSDVIPKIYGGISPQPANNQLVNIVTAQVAEWISDSDLETRAVTVSFQTTQQSFFSTPAGLRPFGVVQFGTGTVPGALIYVDICRGAQFTVPGSSVRLFVGLDPVAAGIANQNSMLLAGAISFGPTVRAAPIYRTVYLDNWQNTPYSIFVPPFATRVWFFRMNQATVAATIQVQDSNAQPIYAYDLAAGAQMTAPIPLTSDASNILLTRTAGANGQARLVFELGF
jgi:hypothetical protein